MEMEIMLKRLRGDRCELLVDLINVEAIKDEEENLLLNILGIMEVLELEQSENYSGSLPMNILAKMGNHILFPNWLRTSDGNWINIVDFNFDNVNIHFRDNKMQVDKRILDKIEKLQKNFNFFWLLPKRDKDEWKKWGVFIAMIYVGIRDNVVYPMDMFAVRTLWKCLNGEGCVKIEPKNGVNILLEKVLTRFEQRKAYTKIDFPSFMIPYIEIERRENMDNNLALLRKMIWMNKLTKGIGEKDTPEAFLKAIGVIISKIKFDWAKENTWAQHKNGCYTNNKLLEIVANSLTVHFLHFPKNYKKNERNNG